MEDCEPRPRSRFALPPVGTLMRPNSARHVDMAADGAVRVLARDGLVALTLRAVGEELGVTPQAVRQWFGSAEAMRSAVADEIGRRWVSLLDDPFRLGDARWAGDARDRSALLVPRDQDEVSATRAWLAVCQAARDDEDLAAIHHAREREERRVVARLTAVHGHPLPDDQVTLVVAVVRGLRHAVCSRVDPMTPQVAEKHLRQVLRVLAGHNEAMADHPDTVAAIDCGTNSIKILIGSVLADGSIDVLFRDSRVVRLGQGVDTTGELHPDALDRTFAALDELAAVVREHGVPTERVAFCATSATRDARNSDVFTHGVRERLGVAPRVLSGEEEAALVYAGSMAGRTADGPVLAVDIGGGSTELVLGEPGAGPRAGVTQSTSMDVGSVRLHERHLHDDPPTADQVAACVADVEQHLDAAPVDVSAARTVIGTSGTVKTIACAAMGLTSYDREAFDGAELAVEDVRRACDRLVAMSVADRRALPFMHPGRADVIGAGALIWSRILARATVASVLVSEADLLHGIAATISTSARR